MLAIIKVFQKRMTSWNQQVSQVYDKISQKRKLVEDDVEKEKCKKQKRNIKSHLFIYYDLEMCQGSVAGEIYQIGAKTATSEFSRYILPKGSIEWGVTQNFGGIKVNRDAHGQRQLVNKKQTFKTVDSMKAFKKFITWVKKEKQRGEYEKVILIAHGESDMPVLLNNIGRDNLIHDLKQSVDYFADSLRFFQRNFKSWDKYKLTLIYKRIFPNREAFKAHDALEDSKALCDIIEELTKGNEELINDVIDHCFDVEKSCEIAKRKIKKTLKKNATKKSNGDPRCLKFCSL